MKPWMYWLIAMVLFVCAILVRHIKITPTESTNIQPDANNIIHHPDYGDYPVIVPYEEGMTLYPGQSANIGVLVEFKIPIEVTVNDPNQEKEKE